MTMLPHLRQSAVVLRTPRHQRAASITASYFVQPQHHQQHAQSGNYWQWQQHHPIIITSTRSYLGDAGPITSRRDLPTSATDAIAQREQELWNKARPKYDAIMEHHVRLPTTTTEFETEEQDLDARKKRLIYRSKQRGWLEVDLLLGTWASMHVPQLSVEELDQFEKFVNLETVDIYNVLTLRTDIPEEMKSIAATTNDAGGNGNRTVVEQIQDWVKQSPLGKADREKYVEVKTNHNLI
jgi:succinate dehydrogenase assembly factor 2